MMEEIYKGIPFKVLLVDDEENILRALKRLLLNENIETFTATSGEKALELLGDKTDIGLIISDQRMPGLSGVDFLEKAKRIRPQAIRILLTGYSDIHDTIEAINRGGASKYLTKPWKDEDVLISIREAYQRYSLMEKNKRLSVLVHRQNEELKRWSRELETMVQEQTIEMSLQNETLKKLNERQKSNFKSIIMSLSGLIELRDRDVKSHSRNVAELSSKIAATMGLSKNQIETIFVAALLHDIGKIGLPDSLIIKDMDELTTEGWKEFCLHPVRGQAAVDNIEDLREAGILIRHHHEYFDGTGFPDRLKGEAIPFGARIITMVDFVDRNIGNVFGVGAIERTLRSVEQDLGTKFDPSIFHFLKKPVTELYMRLLSDSCNTEREHEPMGLKEGMVLSRDVKSGTGLLLLSKGATLDDVSIEAIKRYYRIDPPARGVFVSVK